MTDNMQRAREILAEEFRRELWHMDAHAVLEPDSDDIYGPALRAIAAALRLSAPPDRIVLWSRNVSPHWFFMAQLSKRPPMEGSPVYETMDPVVLQGSPEALRLSAGADWQPIETAPSGETVVVFWRELQDPYDTARYGLDVLEDGVWNHHEECHQHFLSVAPPGSHGPSESAPYTHWMKLGAPLPAAPRHEPGEG